MTRRTDWSISALRALSMFCIVACHLCQCYGFGAAWALNIGVQVFFVISGWLYGLHADVEGVGRWYGRRLLRIAVPYWLVLVPLLLADAFFTPHVPTVKQATLSLAMIRSGSVPNGAHLWYVSTILFCYLINPLLASLWKHWRFLPIGAVGVLVFLAGGRIVAEGFWCFCYVIAFGIGRLVRGGVSDRRAMAVTAICAGGGARCADR